MELIDAQRMLRRLAIVLVVVGGGVVGAASAVASPVTSLVAQGSSPSISATGRFIAFQSGIHLFLRDTLFGTTEQVDVTTAGTPANDYSYTPEVSAHGRYILFASGATNLYPHDTNDSDDLFIRDRKFGTTTRLPHVVSEQVEGDWFLSATGRYIGYSGPGHDPTVYRYDRQTGNVLSGDVGRDEASFFAISADGRTALVQGEGAPMIWKPLSGRLFRYDQALGGGHANSWVSADALSADGHIVMFSSPATNLVRHDTNNAIDVFIRNLRTHRTRRVSVAGVHHHGQANGGSGGLALSWHGDQRLFWSAATNLVSGDRNAKIDIFLRSGPTHTTRRCNVSTAGDEATRGSRVAALSLDGSYIAFRSGATNLIPNDTDGKPDIFSRSPGC